MVVIVPPPAALSADIVEAYYVVDELLARSPIIVFYGLSATPTAGLNNSRIQSHVFTPAGFQSYSRLTVAPSSPLYAAVNCLPRQEQGDEVSRGLAFSLYKYFTELPQVVKDVWEKQQARLVRRQSAPPLFGEEHAAALASSMAKVENTAQIIVDVRRALGEQSVSWLDVDLVLPAGTMQKVDPAGRDSILPDPTDHEILQARYGEYAELVQLFGEASFLPTSRMKRAPSKATAINSASVFTRMQKENVRRELCELLDTEENYVQKVHELVHELAADFRQRARDKKSSSASPTAEALQSLFPASLDHILALNTAFLDALRKSVEETENDAITDIEYTPEEGSVLPSVPTRSDVTGTLAAAMVLRTWFPKFADSYGDYMRAHISFSKHMRVFMNETNSSFSKRVQETGEQRLTSLLIEPVQRLPRYQLYIDNILKQLPARHPAMKSLLKARDVITAICAQDDTVASPAKTMDSLRKLVPSWPASFCPEGRLITCVDVEELPPPYRRDAASSLKTPGILLLFSDFVVILRKTTVGAPNARSLIAQVDELEVAGQPGLLSFRQALELYSFDITEMDDGNLLQLTPVQIASREERPRSSRPGSLNGESQVQVFRLWGTCEGKAPRFTEDFVKARVEGRFSERERDSHRWEVRTAAAADLTLFSAVHEENSDGHVPVRAPAAQFQIYLGQPARKSDINNNDSLNATVYALPGGYYRLEINGAELSGIVDTLTSGEFLPVLRKRIHNILQMRSQIRNPALTATLLARNQHILQALHISLPVSMKEPESNSRGTLSRPQSPVKLLSNLFGGAISRERSIRRQNTAPTLTFSSIPQLAPTSTSPASRPPSKDGNKSLLSIASTQSSVAENGRLDDVLSSYVLALQSRKGNMVGKLLRERAAADDLIVNEVYNSLLADPLNHQVAAQAPIDVLFSAFERFVHVAWQDAHGAIITNQTADLFDEYLVAGHELAVTISNVSTSMHDTTRKAFSTIVKLLAELLRDTGSDSDRGVLTASFAEVLLPQDGPRRIVALLDRLVENVDLLDYANPPSIQPTPCGSMTSRHGNFMGNNTIGSTPSSSLRRKFGLSALTRKSSKAADSDDGSLWRTLSKTRQASTSQTSLEAENPASNVVRSRSIDTDSRAGPKRQGSREKSTIIPSFAPNNLGQLSTIGEHPFSPPPRKKRRSSISDLRSLQSSSNNSPAPNPLSPPAAGATVLTNSPRTPSAIKASMIPAPSPITTRLQTGSLRGISPYRQENSPSRTLPRPVNSSKPAVDSTKADEVIISTHGSPRRRADTAIARTGSNLSSLKPNPLTGLFERPNAANARKLPPVPSSPEKPPARLRMQSPQKLRDRLKSEKEALEAADATLQAELSKIGEEITNPFNRREAIVGEHTGALKPILGRSRTNLSPSPANVLNGTAPIEPAAKLKAFSKTQTQLLAAMKARLESLESDITSSLQVSESRAKKLDILYRDANAENEALYSKFNEELERFVSKVRLSGGREAEKEVIGRLRRAEEEAEGLRRENARLKREVVGLRAQLRE